MLFTKGTVFLLGIIPLEHLDVFAAAFPDGEWHILIHVISGLAMGIRFHGYTSRNSTYQQMTIWLDCHPAT